MTDIELHKLQINRNLKDYFVSDDQVLNFLIGNGEAADGLNDLPINLYEGSVLGLGVLLTYTEMLLMGSKP